MIILQIVLILMFFAEGLLIATKTMENTRFSASLNCFLIGTLLLIEALN